LNPIPDRDRVFLDEACVKELHAQDAARQVGVCRLKGFDGFHRVFELRGSEG
jgi:class 3 adenylate cyclase